MTIRYEEYDPTNPQHAGLPLYEMRSAERADVYATVPVEVTDPEVRRFAQEAPWYFLVKIDGGER